MEVCPFCRREHKTWRPCAAQVKYDRKMRSLLRVLKDTERRGPAR